MPRPFFVKLKIMALQSVEDMVRGWLPWLPPAGQNLPLDAQITAYKINTYYFLQSYLGIADVDVENDAIYTGVKRLLVAAMVAYDMIVNKVYENLGGNSTGTVQPGSGAQRIKKGKADVVEAEFDYSKASDGNALLMNTEKLLADLKAKICAYAVTLKINLPMCDCGDTEVCPPFLTVVEDCDPLHDYNPQNQTGWPFL